MLQHYRFGKPSCFALVEQHLSPLCQEEVILMQAAATAELKRTKAARAVMLPSISALGPLPQWASMASDPAPARFDLSDS